MKADGFLVSVMLKSTHLNVKVKVNMRFKGICAGCNLTDVQEMTTFFTPETCSYSDAVADVLSLRPQSH